MPGEAGAGAIRKMSPPWGERAMGGGGAFLAVCLFEREGEIASRFYPQNALLPFIAKTPPALIMN